jgi:TetR/AcrR family transcriptional regulator, transcriptional repressor for nem operon
MSDRSTKERILDAAEGLMLEKSFHAVGLNEILATVKVPKGSFYHHFDSKEQFGVEMLRHYVSHATAYKTKLLLSPTPEPDPVQRLLTYLESNVARMLENEGRCPCLVVKLSSEVASFSEPMREVLAEGSKAWIGIFEKLLKEAVSKGKVSPRLKTARIAAFIMDLWTGAMQRASIARSVTPLREAISNIKAALAV